MEETDIREWHQSPTSQGLGLPAGTRSENMKKCWEVGSHMIQQFDEQDEDESDDDESGSEDGEKKKSSSEEDEEEEDDEDGDEDEDDSDSSSK